MSWDSMDMWWMDKPDRSNLPELATGAFLQGMQMAQKKAQFDAMLPMEVAESNARTAAQVAQARIATQKADRETAEWERVAKEEPIFADYSQKVASWMSNPLSGQDVPAAPVGLSGDFRAKADKMMLDAAMMKRQENAKSLAAQVMISDIEDTTKLVQEGYLTLESAKDPQAKKLAKMNRAGREANAMAAQMGIMDMPSTNVPTLPNGDLDKEQWAFTLRQFRPEPKVPAGMVADTLTITDAQGNKFTYKAPEPQKAKETREEYIRRVSADAISKGLSADSAATEAARVWDISSGKQPATPSAPVEVSKTTIQEQWDKMPGGTQFVATEDITLPDGGKIKKGTTVTKKTDVQVKKERGDKLVERRNELRSDIRVGSKQGPFDEVVTPEQLSEESRTMPDRIGASTFMAPQGSNAVRRRTRTPEDDARLRKMQEELSNVLQQLDALK